MTDWIGEYHSNDYNDFLQPATVVAKTQFPRKGGYATFGPCWDEVSHHFCGIYFIPMSGIRFASLLEKGSLCVVSSVPFDVALARCPRPI